MSPTVTPNVAVVRAIPGEPTTFEVRSKSNPNGSAEHSGWHHVDVAAHGGAGECSCIRWSTVCWPLIRDTKNLPPSKRCRHLKAAREMFCNRAIAGLPRYE